MFTGTSGSFDSLQDPDQDSIVQIEAQIDYSESTYLTMTFI